MTIVVQTRSGAMTITAIAPATGSCAGCRGDAELHLIPRAGAIHNAPPTVMLCGQCLVTGMAVWLGAGAPGATHHNEGEPQ